MAKQSSTSELPQASIYDFPKYYELAFGSDWDAEVRFLQEVFDLHVDGRVRSVLEPACGNGRILYHFAKEGYRVDGFDLSQVSLDYCQARLDRHGLKSTVWLADMAQFSTKKRYDAAFIMLNSFRHLMDNASAEEHLRCMAHAVRSGGIYVMGLYLTPTQAELSHRENWTASKGNLTVNTDVRFVKLDLRARTVTYSMRFEVVTPKRKQMFEHELVLRSYTLAQFLKLIKSVPEWEIAEVYDFHYESDCPIFVNGATEDAVFVLKRR
jgi:SAM-dependent methyltransferase